MDFYYGGLHSTVDPMFVDMIGCFPMVIFLSLQVESYSEAAHDALLFQFTTL